MTIDWFLIAVIMAALLLVVSLAALAALVALGRDNLMDKFSDTVSRIVNSKKVILMAVPMISSIIVQLTGYDPTSKAMLLLDAGFTLLTVLQGVHDSIHGSQSDGTARVATSTKESSSVITTTVEAAPVATVNVSDATSEYNKKALALSAEARGAHAKPTKEELIAALNNLIAQLS